MPEGVMGARMPHPLCGATGLLKPGREFRPTGLDNEIMTHMNLALSWGREHLKDRLREEGLISYFF